MVKHLEHPLYQNQYLKFKENIFLIIKELVLLRDNVERSWPIGDGFLSICCVDDK